MTPASLPHFRTSQIFPTANNTKYFFQTPHYSTEINAEVSLISILVTLQVSFSSLCYQFFKIFTRLLTIKRALHPCSAEHWPAYTTSCSGLEEFESPLHIYSSTARNSALWYPKLTTLGRAVNRERGGKKRFLFSKGKVLGYNIETGLHPLYQRFLHPKLKSSPCYLIYEHNSPSRCKRSVLCLL